MFLDADGSGLVAGLGNLGPVNIALAVLMALGVAAACLWLVANGPRRIARRSAGTVDHAVTASVFVFDEHRLVSAPRDWNDFLALQAEDASDWESLRALLDTRFPGMPEQAELPTASPFLRLDAHDPADRAVLRLQQDGTNLRLTLSEPSAPSTVDRHLAHLRGQVLDGLQQAVEHMPVPAWRSEDDGSISRRNAAYRALEPDFNGNSRLTGPLDSAGDGMREQPLASYRVMLEARGRIPERWYDVSARRREDGWDCTALDVTGLVRAELAQRNFVQTLTKTFAQLSTALAIFDRNRQLVLFNPALVDLTSLSPEFLTGRPALSQFFDQLRDRQIMPEPKNYSSWREQLHAVVDAAADGRYQETWSLANGATYRVTGRPHPDGAIAFLFEDITDEIAITRRFRHQLSLSQAVLDAMNDAVVIFDAQGAMSYCNAAYRDLFKLSAGRDLSDITVRDAHADWSRKALSPQGLDELLSHVLSGSGNAPWHETLILEENGETGCSVLPLVAGSCMVTFDSRPPATGPSSGGPSNTGPASDRTQGSSSGFTGIIRAAQEQDRIIEHGPALRSRS